MITEIARDEEPAAASPPGNNAEEEAAAQEGAPTEENASAPEEEVEKEEAVTEDGVPNRVLNGENDSEPRFPAAADPASLSVHVEQMLWYDMAVPPITGSTPLSGHRGPTRGANLPPFMT